MTLGKDTQSKLKVIYASYPYNFVHFKVYLCDITQSKLCYLSEMVDEKVGMILHRSKRDIERCFLQFPGVLQKFKIPRKIEETVGNVVSRRDLYVLNTAAEKFGILTITVVEDS